VTSGVRYYETIAGFREWFQDMAVLVARFGKAMNEKNNAFLFGFGRGTVDVKESNILAIGSDLCDVLLPWAGQRHFDMKVSRMFHESRDMQEIPNLLALAAVC
jgi:hypothetical protein